MPGLWAAATEIKMISDRDRLLDIRDDDGPTAITAKVLIDAERKEEEADPHGPWTMSDRPTGAWPDFHSLTIW